MRNIFENKPKFFFLVEVILVVVAIIAAFAAGYIYKDATDDVPKETEDTSLTTFTYTNEELQASVNQKTITGKVVKVSATSLTTSTSGKNIILVLSKDTVIEKGVKLTKSSYQELAVGKQITVAYNIKTNEAINVWFDK